MEQAPIILVVSQTRQMAGLLEDLLRQRYIEGYSIVFVSADADPMAFVRLLRDQQAQVALMIYEGEGAVFLSEGGALYPEAGRLLIGEEAGEALDYSLVTVWTPPEAHLYPVLDELLAEWRASVNRSFSLVSGIMTVRMVRVRISDSLHRAAEVIALSGVGDLMVIDNDNNFVGVLSEGDVLRAAMPDFVAAG